MFMQKTKLSMEHVCTAQCSCAPCVGSVGLMMMAVGAV